MNEENHNLSKLLDGTPEYSDTKLVICEGALQGAGCGRRPLHQLHISASPWV